MDAVDQFIFNKRTIFLAALKAKKVQQLIADEMKRESFSGIAAPEIEPLRNSKRSWWSRLEREEI